MIIDRLQLLSVRTFTALGRLVERMQDWIFRHPRLSNWVFRDAGEISRDRYSENNSWIFAQYAEQERMLADKPRMRFYHEMIRRQIKAGDRVIDLGTGTGILAAFASSQGAAKVYALDHSAIIEEARVLAAHNHVANVEFLSLHSTRFTLDEPVDVILHEQMGDALFDEEMVANVLDLRDRLLKSGGRILPARFELYCEPVQLREERLVPFLWELNVHGYDFSPLASNRPIEASYYNYSTTDPTLVAHFLCEPMPLLTIDLETLRRTDLPLELTTSSPIVRDGRLDAYVVYFRALADDDLVLSTNPIEAGRAPHWGYRLLRTDQIKVAVGDILETTLAAEHWPEVDTWRWYPVRYTAEQARECADWAVED